MTIEALQQQLRCLGWKARDLGRQPDGQWMLWVTSCGHTICAIRNTRHAAWSAAHFMAMKLTFHQQPALDLSLPSDTQPMRPGFLSYKATPMMTEQERELIAEYEYLRKCSICLFRKWNEIDERMLEIESQLPDSYTFPGDPPLDIDEDETQDG